MTNRVTLHDKQLNACLACVVLGTQLLFMLKALAGYMDLPGSQVLSKDFRVFENYKSNITWLSLKRQSLLPCSHKFGSLFAVSPTLL